MLGFWARAAILAVCLSIFGSSQASAARSAVEVICTNHGCSDFRNPYFHRYDAPARQSFQPARKKNRALRQVRDRAPIVSRGGLVSIQCGPRAIKVASGASRQFASFCNDLYASFKFRAIGGWRPGKCWVGGKHPCGGAIDVSQSCRSRGPGHCLPRDFPVALTERLADRYGLQPGSRWGYRDVGHFEIKNGLASNGWTPKTADVIAAKADEPAPKRWPIAHSEMKLAAADTSVPMTYPSEEAPAPVPVQPVRADRGDDLLAKFPGAARAAEAALFSIYSELPPKERPIIAVLASLRDVPIGTPKEEVARAAELFKVSPQFMAAVCEIESSCKPRTCTKSYCGLFQFGTRKWDSWSRWGNGNPDAIYSARVNAIVAANKFATETAMFRGSFGREPTPRELYCIHQQGWQGCEQHLENPDRRAIDSMFASSEAQAKEKNKKGSGADFATRAICGNLPDTLRLGCHSITSGDFVKVWGREVDRLMTGVASIVIPPAHAGVKVASVKKAKRHHRYAHHKKKRHRHYASVR